MRVYMRLYMHMLSSSKNSNKYTLLTITRAHASLFYEQIVILKVSSGFPFKMGFPNRGKPIMTFFVFFWIGLVNSKVILNESAVVVWFVCVFQHIYELSCPLLFGFQNIVKICLYQCYLQSWRLCIYDERQLILVLTQFKVALVLLLLSY